MSAAVVGVSYYLINDRTLTSTTITSTQSAKPVQGLAVGNPFPSFSFTEVDGRPLTNVIFSGKPTILWFTTSWCVPCQIGAQDVAKLDKSLGDNKFEVIVVFVDPKETLEDLTEWRRRFANDDWNVAFDNPNDPVARKVRLQYLDSKYLLDSDGILRNIDFRIVNDDYLSVLTRVVGGV